MYLESSFESERRVSLQFIERQNLQCEHKITLRVIKVTRKMRQRAKSSGYHFELQL